MGLEWKMSKYKGNAGGFKLSNKYRTFITALQEEDMIAIKDEIEKALVTISKHDTPNPYSR